MRSALLSPLLLLPLSVMAVGNDGGFQCKYEGNQQEMNACAVRDFKIADKALNEKYKELMSVLPSARQQRLRQEQRAWLKKRDPICKEEAEPSKGGSIWPLEFFGCLQSATEDRTKELERWQRK